MTTVIVGGTGFPLEPRPGAPAPVTLSPPEDDPLPAEAHDDEQEDD